FFKLYIFFIILSFAILVGMFIPEFLQFCVIVSGDAPDCLNFDVRLLYYCNDPFVDSLYWPFVASDFFG
ncbi:unnamed protein product, partial [Prunus brigantina]